MGRGGGALGWGAFSSLQGSPFSHACTSACFVISAPALPPGALKWKKPAWGFPHLVADQAECCLRMGLTAPQPGLRGGGSGLALQIHLTGFPWHVLAITLAPTGCSWLGAERFSGDVPGDQSMLSSSGDSEVGQVWGSAQAEPAQPGVIPRSHSQLVLEAQHSGSYGRSYKRRKPPHPAETDGDSRGGEGAGAGAD